LDLAISQIRLPAEFGGFNVPSLEMEANSAHYASFTATLANLISDYEDASLGALYGMLCTELKNVAFSSNTWAVQLRAAWAEVAKTGGGFTVPELETVSATVNQDVHQYLGEDMELITYSDMLSHGTAPVWAEDAKWYLSVPSPASVAEGSTFVGRIQRDITRTLRVRAFLDLLHSPLTTLPDYLRISSGTGKAAMAIFFASHEEAYRIPASSYTMAVHRVLNLIPAEASLLRTCPRCHQGPDTDSDSSSVLGTGTTEGTYGRQPIHILLDHIPRCPRSRYVTEVHNRLVTVLQDMMQEAGGTKNHDLWLELCHVYGARSQARPGDVAWLNFSRPNRHLVVDVTIPSARTNTNLTRSRTHLPVPGALGLAAQQAKFDRDVQASTRTGTPPVHTVHEYYPFVVEDGGRLAPLACELLDRLAVLVALRRFPGFGAHVARSLRSESLPRMKKFVRESTSPIFRRFLGDVRREFFQRVSIVLHSTLGSYLADAVQGGRAAAVCCFSAQHTS
jgi:hypothetical protein